MNHGKMHVNQSSIDQALEILEVTHEGEGLKILME